MNDPEKSLDGLVRDALQATAEVPLGMTARLEMSVVRRGRERAGFSVEEKVCAVAAAMGTVLVGGGPLNVGLLIVAGLVALGYAQWTILLDEES